MGGVGLLVEGPIVYVSSGVKGVLVGSGLVFSLILGVQYHASNRNKF